MIKKICLMGNPNVGKSAIFSRLTGVHVDSSNYPGTTVELTKGYLSLGKEQIEVVDLPGTYSLETNSSAEEVATSLLKEYSKDEMTVINILDSTNLERNLLLTLQLIEGGFSMIVCLNMADDAVHRGVHIDSRKLEELLGVPVVSTCAVTGEGIKSLITRIPQAVRVSRDKSSYDEYWKEIGRIIDQAQHLEHRHHSLREVLEDASVQPISGFMIAAVVLFVSFVIVRAIGETIINRIADPFFINIYQPFLEKLTVNWQPSSFGFHLLIGDLVDGRIDFKQSLGVLTTAPYIELGMVLPYVVSFYFILCLFEDIGYLPRLAILLDNFMHRLGLHGYAIIPVLLGFGCNVPGILSTRVLESKRERFIAATIISIGVPCVPLQAMIFGLLGSFGGLYVLGVYAVLFFIVFIFGLVLNKLMPGDSSEFLLELPPYRFPPLFMLARKLYIRVKGFLFEAFPVVLAGVLILNILLFFRLFDFITGIFAPAMHVLFDLPKESIIALIVGFFRKEVAVGMLLPLDLSVKQIFIATTLLAISFPCVATFMVLWKELGFAGLFKSTLLMLVISVIVGAILNFVIL